MGLFSVNNCLNNNVFNNEFLRNSCQCSFIIYHLTVCIYDRFIEYTINIYYVDRMKLILLNMFSKMRSLMRCYLCNYIAILIMICDIEKYESISKMNKKIVRY